MWIPCQARFFFIAHREMRLTSPRLSLVVALGGIVWYTSATVVTIPTTDLAVVTALCEVRDVNHCITPAYARALKQCFRELICWAYQVIS